MAELGAAQVGLAQIAAHEVGSGQIALLQILAGQVGARQIGALSSRMALMEFLVRLENVFQLLAFVSNVFPPSQTAGAAGKAPVASLTFSEWMS